MAIFNRLKENITFIIQLRDLMQLTFKIGALLMNWITKVLDPVTYTTCTCTYICTCINTVCTRVYVHVHMYVTNLYINTYVHVSADVIYIYMYLCKYAMYVHVHVSFFFLSFLLSFYISCNIVYVVYAWTCTFIPTCIYSYIQCTLAG